MPLVSFIVYGVIVDFDIDNLFANINFMPKYTPIKELPSNTSRSNFAWQVENFPLDPEQTRINTSAIQKYRRLCNFGSLTIASCWRSEAKDYDYEPKGIKDMYPTRQKVALIRDEKIEKIASEKGWPYALKFELSARLAGTAIDHLAGSFYDNGNLNPNIERMFLNVLPLCMSSTPAVMSIAMNESLSKGITEGAIFYALTHKSIMDSEEELGFNPKDRRMSLMPYLPIIKTLRAIIPLVSQKYPLVVEK